MLSESSQVSKQSDAIAKSFPSVFDVLFGQVNHANQCVEVIIASTYMLELLL